MEPLGGTVPVASPQGAARPQDTGQARRPVRAASLHPRAVAASNHRSGFCTKFQSATDMVRNTFRDDKLRVISCEVQNARKAKDV
ncbi:hypothetical protein NE591_15005, partial [Adlercreutzia sp. DFI.6.23]|nr:hypothetical protein [Adlercreutzia sp. DFI.6.23]